MSGYSRQSNLARARFFIHTTVPYAVLLSCFPAFGPSYIALFSASFSRSWCFFPSMSSHFTPPHYALHQSQNVPPTTSNHMPSSHHIPTGISKGTSQFTPTRVTLHSARTFCQSVPRNPYALARHHATKLFFCLFSSEHRSHITCSLSSFGLPASTVHRISPLHLISSIFLNALPTHFWLSLRTLPKVCSDFSHHLIMTNVATNPMKCIMTSSLIQSKNTVFLWRLAYCWAKSHLFPFHRPHIPISSLLPPPLLSTAPPPTPNVPTFTTSDVCPAPFHLGSCRWLRHLVLSHVETKDRECRSSLTQGRQPCNHPSRIVGTNRNQKSISKRRRSYLLSGTCPLHPQNSQFGHKTPCCC